ncbi:hypothetical protein NEUTE1DRAFT_45010 [Neurospora tetrasperma FGSC 2508]|uniref:Uncharacterized protein n=1 Tax=Neurospora tetrasperma (strain FGSC 2508 / ATCC MYA-4615 / P0657) TaxID=510951 RepID=F8MQT0_NEUT8|nr:uncharacterized protein NEUTE1DRAFT_45010 [Neurospora tetrasperma FGSC 2508]EGO56710.1 hypothetical protein NEUTE1DRAFT_45010 [Neurospora tetrasperma FGSC 2508]EGZ70415.1 hypothetical protein NEUTE2DRAFT_130417 [Neurospora tetrasperma FGSC 2509]
MGTGGSRGVYQDAIHVKDLGEYTHGNRSFVHGTDLSSVRYIWLSTEFPEFIARTDVRSNGAYKAITRSNLNLTVGPARSTRLGSGRNILSTPHEFVPSNAENRTLAARSFRTD